MKQLNLSQGGGVCEGIMAPSTVHSDSKLRKMAVRFHNSVGDFNEIIKQVSHIEQNGCMQFTSCLKKGLTPNSEQQNSTPVTGFNGHGIFRPHI